MTLEHKPPGGVHKGGVGVSNVVVVVVACGAAEAAPAKARARRAVKVFIEV